MSHINFKRQDGCTFRIPRFEMPGNCNIEQRFKTNEGAEIWHVVYGPNQQLRQLAFDALAQANVEV